MSVILLEVNVYVLFFYLGDECLWVQTIYGGGMLGGHRCVTRSIECRQIGVGT